MTLRAAVRALNLATSPGRRARESTSAVSRAGLDAAAVEQLIDPGVGVVPEVVLAYGALHAARTRMHERHEHAFLLGGGGGPADHVHAGIARVEPWQEDVELQRLVAHAD